MSINYDSYLIYHTYWFTLNSEWICFGSCSILIVFRNVQNIDVYYQSDWN